MCKLTTDNAAKFNIGMSITKMFPLRGLQFEGETLNLLSLLDRYKAYLVRMKARGLNPFKDQSDLHFTEARGFHRIKVDTLPSFGLDVLVGQFREMYLDRPKYHLTNWLHGLALIGVRAVLGVDSERGSLFNVQRSLHVPNFTLDEVTDLFDQYQLESGQRHG